MTCDKQLSIKCIGRMTKTDAIYNNTKIFLILSYIVCFFFVYAMMSNYKLILNVLIYIYGISHFK